MADARTGVELRVEALATADAGRGIARLPADAQAALGVVSGDDVLLEGDGVAAATVWPAPADAEGVRLGPVTRDAAGTRVGEPVVVRRASVDPAGAVRLRPATDAAHAQRKQIGTALLDTVVRPGAAVHLDDLGTFDVVDARPDGAVRVTEHTDIDVTTDEAAEAGSGSGNAASVPETSYDDIGGLDRELERVRELIELPLAEPEQFDRLGVEPPSGVLLHGPPGTGKTLIARAVANEVDAHFEPISGPEIVSKYKGESAQRLRAAFERAAAQAPAVVFIDEIDSIASTRDADADMENRVVAQLLTLLDGVAASERIVVVGATNRLDAVDPALRRGGRFDREIEVGVPDEAGRRQILAVHTRSAALADDVDLDDLAARTHGFVGADLAALVREAAIHALQADRDRLELTGVDFTTALSGVEPSAMREYVAEQPDVTFADVGGLGAAKQALREAVEWPLSYGPLYDAAGTEPPTGVLLHGPPGTGKTLLARATAGESGVNFIEVAGPSLLDRYVGESEAAVRAVFERARRAAPAIVFLDELDAIAGGHEESSEVTERLVSQLVAELDRAAGQPNLVVLAATSRPDALDQSLRRPGRLERHVEVSLPDEAARRAILAIHFADTPLADDVDLDAVAAATGGWSGADLAALARSAAIRAIREVAEDVDPETAGAHADAVAVERSHLEAARSELATGADTAF